ncbi:hypothetical protein FRC17_007304 [Serendipita sp. 399]|nr:hypothetical protein FRC17_007304 [Serendipita sp. 399]
MISRDVEPDRATYSAVTTQAIKQGDFELAQKIMSKAESRGRLPNDPQLLGAICWHTISRENLQGRSRREVRKRLSDVLKLLGPISPSTETIFRERTFGIRAAYAALRSKNPELAYAFWKRCVRYKSIMRQPDDPVTTLAEDSEKRLRMEIFEALEKTESDSFSKREKELLLRPPEVRPVTWRRSSSILP